MAYDNWNEWGGQKPLLEFLPKAVPSQLIPTGTLAGKYGETVTFTRAGTRYYNTNDPLPMRTNLIIRSKDFTSAYWAPQSGGGPGDPTVTAAAAAAPDGTTTATQVDLPGVSGANTFSLLHPSSGAINVLAGTTYTFSLWVKGVSGAGTVYLAAYSNGWTSAPAAYSAGEWTRFSVQIVAGVSRALDPLIGVDLRDVTQSAKSAQSIYIWGAQLEEGSTATDLIQTTGAVASVNPPVALLASGAPELTAAGLLASGVAEVQHHYSQTITSWTKRGTAAVASGYTAPDGTATACLVSGIQGFVTGDIYANGTASLPSVAAVQLSFWIRRVSTSGTLNITSSSGGNPFEWNVDLAALPDSWVRLYEGHSAVSVVTPGSGICGGIQIHRGSGASQLSFLLWGVQQEKGKVVHGYVPTPGAATVSCPADLSSVQTARLPQAAGYIECAYTPNWSGTPYAAARLWNSTTSGDSDITTAYINTSNGSITGIVNNIVISSAAISWVAGQTYRIRLEWGGGNVYLWKDGILAASDTTGTGTPPASTHTRLYVGAYTSSIQSGDGWIRDVRAGYF